MHIRHKIEKDTPKCIVLILYYILRDRLLYIAYERYPLSIGSLPILLIMEKEKRREEKVGVVILLLLRLVF